MRTTITLDPDVEALVKRTMAERGVSFKEAVNSAIRSGLGGGPHRIDFSFPSYELGAPTIDLDRALRIADGLADDETARALQVGR